MTTTPIKPPAAGEAGEAASQDAQKEQIKHTLEQELRQVRTPEDAERIVMQLEGRAAGSTESDQADAARLDPAPAAVEVEKARRTASAGGSTQEASAVLAETAQQSVSHTPGGAAAVDAAQEALAPDNAATPGADPQSARGAGLLRQAVLRRLDPLSRLDVRVFLAINSAPHPAWLDDAAHKMAVWTNGGWFWSAGLLAARLAGVHRAGPALAVALPTIGIATAIVEFPLKSIFRRKRPFIDVVRALVVGKKPGSWSFPSGHTATAFAGAWVISTIWPRLTPVLFALAGTIGFSRIYVGNHYPGDVMSGAFFGMALSELFRRATLLILEKFAPRWR